MYQIPQLSREIVEMFRVELIRGLEHYRVRVRPNISETGSLHQVKINVPHLNILFPSQRVQEAASVFLAWERGAYVTPIRVNVETEWYGIPPDEIGNLKGRRLAVSSIDDRIKTGDFNYEIVPFGRGFVLRVPDGSYSYEGLPDAGKIVANHVGTVLELYKTPKADRTWKQRVSTTETIERIAQVSQDLLRYIDMMNDEDFEDAVESFALAMQGRDNQLYKSLQIGKALSRRN